MVIREGRAVPSFHSKRLKRLDEMKSCTNGDRALFLRLVTNIMQEAEHVTHASSGSYCGQDERCMWHKVALIASLL